MPRLTVNLGRRDEQVIDLIAGTVSIGRGREVDVRVANKSLSRFHATIDIDANGRATLRDAGSKNGTFVGGMRLEQAQPLSDGTIFNCGDVAFLFHSEEYSVPPPETMIQEIPSDTNREQLKALLTDSRLRRQAEKSGLPPARRPNSPEGRLQVLLEVARLLSSPQGIDKQLAKIIDLVFSILDVDRAALIMLDEDTGEFGPPAVEASRKGLKTTGEVYSQHVLRYVRERSVSALFSDAKADPRLAGAHSIHIQSVRSSMCAPLKPHDKVIGALYVDNLTVPAAFTGEDLELLSAFAAQAAIAIDNARLYERLEKEAVTRNNLLRFFPPTTIAQLMERPQMTVEAIDTEVTALFCDISGFTAMSATMAPRDVVRLLNRYFPKMTEVVFRYEGTLEKYIGDAILAVWGAPFRRDDDAMRAVQAAVGMQRAIRELSETTNFPALSIHIGLNSGPVAAGNIGSEQLLQYATIGSATNMASRICDVAEAGEIALGESTVERLGPNPPFELDGPFQHYVKGRVQPLPVYKLRFGD